MCFFRLISSLIVVCIVDMKILYAGILLAAVSVVSVNLVLFILYTIESILSNFDCSCESPIRRNDKIENVVNTCLRSLLDFNLYMIFGMSKKVAPNVDGLLPGWVLCSVRPATELVNKLILKL